MKKLIPLRGGDGEEVLFDSSEGEVVGGVIGGVIGAVTLGQGSFEVVDAGKPIESLAEIGKQLQKHSAELIRGFTAQQPSQLLPSEVEIEFGVKLGGKGKLIFVEGSAESHLQVKLKWILRAS
jgi:Trypsin-co-occurring domain 1